MRRRVEESSGAEPQAEMVDYKRWCAARGAAPYGHVLAPAQWDEWMEQRQRWAAAHGGNDDGCGSLGRCGDAPWRDEPVNLATHDVTYWPDGSVARISRKPGV